MELNSTWLLIASVLATLTCGAHFFAGGYFSARPLLNSALHSVPKYTNYYCWHLVTITILAIAAGFAIPARYPDAWELAAAALLLSVSFTIWNVVLVIWKRQKPWFMPQWAMFLSVSVVGGLAFYSG